MDSVIFLATLVALAVGLPLYRARHEQPWKIAAGLVAGLVLVTVLAIALSWAGIDVGRLQLLLAPALAVALAAAFVIVLRMAQRRRESLPRESPYAFPTAGARVNEEKLGVRAGACLAAPGGQLSQSLPG